MIVLYDNYNLSNILKNIFIYKILSMYHFPFGLYSNQILFKFDFIFWKLNLAIGSI